MPQDTTAQELAEYFSYFSPVIKAKAISDEYRLPKGYGFVTFQNEDDVRNVTEMGTLFWRNKKLNLGPAVVVILAPISPDQSERSKFSLDQSESSISPM